LSCWARGSDGCFQVRTTAEAHSASRKTYQTLPSLALMARREVHGGPNPTPINSWTDRVSTPHTPNKERLAGKD
jgi:hypothetical protein